VARYIDALDLGEPVRFAEVMWAIMSEPGVADVRNLKLQRYPPSVEDSAPGEGGNVAVRPTQIATLVESDSKLRVL
jgi:hypothetical protein